MNGGAGKASSLARVAVNAVLTWCREAELNCRHKDFQSFALPLSYPGARRTLMNTGGW